MFAETSNNVPKIARNLVYYNMIKYLANSKTIAQAIIAPETVAYATIDQSTNSQILDLEMRGKFLDFSRIMIPLLDFFIPVLGIICFLILAFSKSHLRFWKVPAGHERVL